MNRQRLKDFNDKIHHYVQVRRLSAAFAMLGVMIDELMAGWQVREQLNRLRQSYSYMTQYALDGINDPQRQEVYDSIVNGITDLLTLLNREVKLMDDPSLYYSTLRYHRSLPDVSVTSLVERYRKELTHLDMAVLAGNDAPSVERMRNDIERLERDIFNRVWVTCPLTADDELAISGLINDETIDSSGRSLMISAVMMLLLANYDDRGMYLLLHTYYTAVDTSLKVQALCAFLIALSIYRHRRPSGRVLSLLDTVREMPQWDDDVKMVSLQFIRTRDTEKINRKMREEVIPEMLKLRPDIYKKINENPEAMNDMASLDDINPEWEELLDKSGVADKMKELQEMQEDGADVMMSTFSHLKTYPFFSDISNWFLPFRPQHTALSSAAGATVLAGVMSCSTFLCDSDKYSVALSVASMPKAQRDMISNQFRLQNVNLEELKGATLSGKMTQRADEARRYVQNIYRFFKLFRRKGEFNDPFATTLNLATVGLLNDVFGNYEHLSVVAAFYFKHGYYEDALPLLRRLLELHGPDAATSQQIGFALSKLGRQQEALEAYRQAELLNANDVWTLRHIASTLRMMGMTREALDYYMRLARLRPDDLKIAMLSGHCYMELGKYRKALAEYFKVEFLDEKSHRALRPIAWCSFLAGDYDRSRDYYSRLEAVTPLTPEDILNMGHLEMATGNYRLAVDRYRATLDMLKHDTSRFASMMQADLPALRAAGVPDLVTGLVLDTLLA